MEKKTADELVTEMKPANHEEKIGTTTIAAIDQLCETTAKDIEEAADALMTSAADVKAELLKIAESVRKHGADAHERQAAFINMTASVRETAQQLHLVVK